MPLGSIRTNLLHVLARRPGVHRYTLWRVAIGTLLTLGIAAIPWTGLLRFDLWAGRHVVRGEEVGLVEAAKAFAFPFLLVNIAILIATRFLGRYLCGFVCPVGNLARIAEWARRSPPGRRRLLTLGLLLFCFLLASITFAFWVDPRVFAAGSSSAIQASSVALLGTTALLFFGARRIGLGFCRDWCPSGVYFSLLGPESKTGIELRHPETCTDCGACDRVCPIDLAPRTMLQEDDGKRRGLYPEASTSLALCLRCGDCVRACEGVNAKQPGPVALHMGLVDAQPGDEAAV